ncbi:MAG: hypothetical protein ACE5NW_14500 [Acidiferrobacterales bacterium]
MAHLPTGLDHDKIAGFLAGASPSVRSPRDLRSRCALVMGGVTKQEAVPGGIKAKAIRKAANDKTF